LRKDKIIPEDLRRRLYKLKNPAEAMKETENGNYLSFDIIKKDIISSAP